MLNFQHTEDAVELQRLLLYLPVPVPVRSLLNQPYPTLEHNRLYLPTTLAAALGLSLADLAAGTADITVSSPHTLFEEFSAVPRPPSVPFAPIPVASEIHIARLKGSGSGRASYAAPCRAYFSSPRLVR